MDRKWEALPHTGRVPCWTRNLRCSTPELPRRCDILARLILQVRIVTLNDSEHGALYLADVTKMRRDEWPPGSSSGAERKYRLLVQRTSTRTPLRIDTNMVETGTGSVPVRIFAAMLGADFGHQQQHTSNKAHSEASKGYSPRRHRKGTSGTNYPFGRSLNIVMWRWYT